MKLRRVISGENNTIEPNVTVGYTFVCPGCKEIHLVYTNPKFSKVVWGYNENIDLPTFSPSILYQPDVPTERCHSFVTNGKIQFLSDCHHELKNQTVDLPEIE